MSIALSIHSCSNESINTGLCKFEISLSIFCFFSLRIISNSIDFFCSFLSSCYKSLNVLILFSSIEPALISFESDLCSIDSSVECNRNRAVKSKACFHFERVIGLHEAWENNLHAKLLRTVHSTDSVHIVQASNFHDTRSSISLILTDTAICPRILISFKRIESARMAHQDFCAIVWVGKSSIEIIKIDEIRLGNLGLISCLTFVEDISWLKHSESKPGITIGEVVGVSFSKRILKPEKILIEVILVEDCCGLVI